VNLTVNVLQIYFKLISLFSSRTAASIAFKLFQKVRIKTVRDREKEFYKKTKHFKVPSIGEDLSCYELGPENEQLIFLLHGWDSNAGSLSKIAFSLSENNFRVISFDLPGHASYQSNHTNIYECKEAFKKVVKYINPQKSFNVIAHSFGSAVTTYTFSKENFSINKIIFLTSPNSILDIFIDFKNLIKLSDKSFSILLKSAQKVLNREVKDLNVDEEIQSISFSKLLLIHDVNDKVIPFKNSESIALKNPTKTKLIKHQDIGHYKMLWSDNVVENILSFLKKE
jgi:esterase/lipase